ncbi:phage tail tape measure protein [Mesonia aestuariivivens]|uniref:Phage tail tape measure protein domain-containing protein n=1 Tax=Mesonia aestuariivivens TaxID=2796128 RepID=A0ABS6W386_9FLAO|nr:phage tail tape measure protein [Mesonia aestuariivivens]MBW2962328.1 hypothetical protein [Mesonia aestuariivivens]
MAVNNSQFNLTIRVNGKEVKNTLNGVGKELRSLRSRTKNLTEGTEEWHRANKELAKTEKIYDDMKKNQRELLNETKKNITAQEDHNATLNEFGGNISQAFQALKAGDLVGFRTAMFGVAGGLKAATRAGLAFLATPIGIGAAALTSIVLGVKRWFDYNKEIAETIKLTEQLTGFDGRRLSQFRAAVQATSETFDKEYNEVLKSANSLAKQMGITQEEALDLINQGFVRGADAQGDFLSKLEEYPVQFKNAGYSAQDFIDIATQEATGGIYNDKLIDAIKEADLALKEMTQTQKDALENAFGKKFAEELANGLQTGKLTTEDAINSIISKSNELGLNLQQKQQLVADVFKGAGEDAGGFEEIIKNINEAFDEENKKLNENEEATQRLVDANTEYEQALADLFDASQSGFPAMLSNLEAITTEIMTGVLEGFRLMFTSIEQLKEQAGLDGQSEAVKRITENVKEFGTTYDEEARIQMEATAKNIERLKQKVTEEEDKWFGDPEEYKVQLSKAEAYYEELKKIAQGTSKELEIYLKETTPDNSNSKNLGAKKTEDELKAEKERAKKLLELKLEYDQMEKDRLAVLESEKLKLKRDAALAEANELHASKELLQKIEDEWKVRIDEAEEKEREEKLEKIREFEERKRELLNELELAKAETDQEKDEIKKEQELEKEELAYQKAEEDFKAEIERLQLNEEEKNAVLQALKESHEATLAGIHEKWKNKEIQKEEEIQQAKRKLWNDSLNAAISFAGEESKVGQILLLAKQVMAAREMVIDFNKFNQKIALQKAEATGNIATGFTETAKVGFPQNIPLIIGFTAQVAGIISTIKQAASAGKSAKKGFAKGGFTDMFGQGYKDGSGHEVAGVVHTNEYVVPEIVRSDPEVPQILDYLETKRKKKLGLYATGGDTANEYSSSGSASASSSSFGNSKIERLLENILLATSENRDILFGSEAELKRQELQKKLDKLKDSTQIKN